MTVLKPREAYRRLAEDYDSSPNALIALEERTVLPLLSRNMTGLTVIDVASGTGRWAKHCRARGARAIGFDLCAEMRPEVQADALRLPLRDASADLVICAFALGYAPKCFQELVRVTRHGGTLLVTDVHPDAIKRGWTRTFQHRGEVIQVADEAYQIAQLHARELVPACLVEPLLGEPEKSIFALMGRLDRFAEASREPAIFVSMWRKPASA
jgi:ubiquinone/menaquinone biosynthesis C-methylase UbiE